MTSENVYLQSVLEECIKNGAFGFGKKYRDFSRSCYEPTDGYQSQSAIGTLVYDDTNTGDDRAVEVFVKMMLDNGRYSNDCSFFNEIIMYQTLVPFFSRFHPSVREMFPDFYYGTLSMWNGKQRAAIVLENLLSKNYRVPRNKVFLDHDHLVLILSKLGQFHACSYAAKAADSVSFAALVNKLGDNNFAVTGECPQYTKTSVEEFAVNELKSDPKYNRRMEVILKIAENPDEVVRSVRTKKKEPISVICHGDFIATNMLFLYRDEKPIDMKVIDLATPFYGSPAADFCSVLYMNTDQYARDAHWDEYVRVYYESLRNAIPNVSVPDKSVVIREIAENASYGFVNASFFIPRLMANQNKRGDENGEQNSNTGLMAEYEKRDHHIQVCLQINNLLSFKEEKSTASVTNIARDIIDRNFG